MEHFLSGMILFDEHAPSSDVYIRNHQGHLLSLINKEAVLAQKIAPRPYFICIPNFEAKSGVWPRHCKMSGGRRRHTQVTTEWR
jgi:hypothetical protein